MYKRQVEQAPLKVVGERYILYPEVAAVLDEVGGRLQVEVGFGYIGDLSRCTPAAVSYTHLDVYKRQKEDDPLGQITEQRVTLSLFQRSFEGSERFTIDILIREGA